MSMLLPHVRNCAGLLRSRLRGDRPIPVRETPEHGQPMRDSIRMIVTIAMLLAAAVFAIVFLFGAIHTIFHESWLIEIAQSQFAATIGLPFAALAAFCIVVILEASYG